MTQSKNLNHGVGDKKKGFTLIEILVTVAIIGILATLISISVMGSQKKARDTKRTADASSMMTAIGQYKENSGVYPAPCGATENFCEFSGAALDPYLSVLPKEPKTNKNYLYQNVGANYQIYVQYESDVKGGKQDTTIPNTLKFTDSFICRVGSDTSKSTDSDSFGAPVCK